MNAPALPFDNSYARLPARFYARLAPTPVREPGLLRVNRPLCETLGIDADWLASPGGIAVVAGNAIPGGAEPLAAAYAGHQFGQYNPQLGDGRALLLGELLDRDGRRFDLQLKGSGPTPWSRGGDGRSPLGPVLREYLVSEGMYALGVPTTRALAAVTTGERVMRDGIEPGAVLARVASSHIRVGTFQYFAVRGDREALETLLGHVIERHYPQARDAANPALAVLEGVIARQAGLIASWQHLGFIHGVMNTDNMLLCGETVDYGPCAFMEAFHPETVFSSIDHGGRYAYQNQPGIAHWNLVRLAETLLPLLHDDQEEAVALAQDTLAAFPRQFSEAHAAGLARKLGLSGLRPDDDELVEGLFAALAEDGADFTLAFRYLSEEGGPEAAALADLFQPGDALRAWLPHWRQRLATAGEDGAARRARQRAANPVFIPRNHLVQAAIEAAEDGDLAPFHRLAERVANPYRWDPADADLARPARPEERVQRTFCGT
ncbi:protein adenylyltransferase SelO [Pseudohaliea rubra]|uniref:Protein nucleotidyltransferase YdiU n=1 Tax=Pseudohaliea rubra DSM 19751 TaxID=1265313 RepID=A0A095XTW9_9GAMM|nr:YdiU family protein [Pseudohaliea rubra]KGE03076.1 Selenoprotein O and cysteine-containing-like protein [Pseudohaliea rubra DSM 19751]